MTPAFVGFIVRSAGGRGCGNGGGILGRARKNHLDLSVGIRVGECGSNRAFRRAGSRPAKLFCRTDTGWMSFWPGAVAMGYCYGNCGAGDEFGRSAWFVGVLVLWSI